MRHRWFAVLCALAVLIQTCHALTGYQAPDVPPNAGENVEEWTEGGCIDINKCSRWPDWYCQRYYRYLKKYCPRKCGHCTCFDNSQYCVAWKSRGYCDSSSQYHNYMKNNCKKGCGFCGGGGGSSCEGAESSKVKSCKFDTDTCDWQDVPFDDDMDFVIRSSNVSGPSSGAGGTGNFLVTQNEIGKAQLLLPLELVLEDHNSNHGLMCLRLHVFMKSGTLKLYSIKNAKDSPKTEVHRWTGDQGSQWKCVAVTVPEVSVHWQLLLEADTDGTEIAIDDISFADGVCS